jgi:hypothetical protein
VFFLIKSAVCIAVVLAVLHWRGADAPAPSNDSHARAAAPQPPRRPRIEDGARDLLQAGANALVSAARDRCIESPRDCAAALQRLQGAARER